MGHALTKQITFYNEQETNGYSTLKKQNWVYKQITFYDEQEMNGYSTLKKQNWVYIKHTDGLILITHKQLANKRYDLTNSTRWVSEGA